MRTFCRNNVGFVKGKNRNERNGNGYKNKLRSES